jgi:hypothetical protein
MHTANPMRTTASWQDLLEIAIQPGTYIATAALRVSGGLVYARVVFGPPAPVRVIVQGQVSSACLSLQTIAVCSRFTHATLQVCSPRNVEAIVEECDFEVVKAPFASDTSMALAPVIAEPPKTLWDHLTEELDV